MLDVRLSDGLDHESLVAFVDRLSAAGDGRQAVEAARARITRDVRADEPPAGVRRLASSLHTPVPPRPRSSSDEPETVVSLVPDEGLVVLSGACDDEVVETIAGLVRRGLRTIVTATGADQPDVVRRRLPDAVSARVVDRLQPIPGPDLRRLRRLLSTSTPARRARGRQDLPDDDALPDPAEISGCCERAARVVEGSESTEGSLLAELLRDLDAERREAVTQVGRCVGRTVGALNESPHAAWLRPVAARLVHNHNRSEFDGLQVLAARQREAAEHLTTAAGVTEEATPPANAVAVLREYLTFLQSGGRTRTYFRSLAQREAQPVLGAFRVNGAVPRTAEEVVAVLRYLDVRDRQAEIEQACAQVGVPVPEQPSHLDELIDALGVAAAAARSVGALRHDVLFLQNDSPVAVPDLPTAERVAAAIIDYDEHGDPAEASDELERIADRLEALSSDPDRTPRSSPPRSRPCGRTTRTPTSRLSTRSASPAGRARTRRRARSCSAGWPRAPRSWRGRGRTAARTGTACSASPPWTRCWPTCPPRTAPTSSSCSVPVRCRRTRCCSPPSHRAWSGSSGTSRARRRRGRRCWRC